MGKSAHGVSTRPRKETPVAFSLASRTSRLHGSAIRELLKITQQPEVISLAGGFPAPELFPIEALQKASETVFRVHGPSALQYGPTEGVGALRARIAATQPFRVLPEQVLVTTGSQQGLFLVSQIMLDPGDYVVVESPTYLGALQTFDAHQAEYLIVESDVKGVIPESLEAVLSNAPVKPKFIYLIPNHQNPSGRTLDAVRRSQVVEIAERHDVLIIEDDPYGPLTFMGHLPPPLRAFSDTHVVYLGSFSKVFAPSLRVGYAIPPAGLFKYMVQLKQTADLQTGNLPQLLALETFAELDFDAHLERLRATYGHRCESMMGALEAYFPKGTTWTNPTGGMFVWVQLDSDVDTQALLDRAVEHKVAFVPGAPFCIDGKGQNALRLNFSNVAPAVIEEGVKRLAGLVKAAAAAAV